MPDPFLEDAAMASPKRRAGAVFRVGNISQVSQPYTNIVALFKDYNSVFFAHDLPWRVCAQLGVRAESGIFTSLLMQHMLAMGVCAKKSTQM